MGGIVKPEEVSSQSRLIVSKHMVIIISSSIIFTRYFQGIVLNMV